MVEAQGVIGGLPALDPTDGPRELGLETVSDLLRMLTSKNPGQRLFHVAENGAFVLGAADVRDASNVVVGAVQPVHEERAQDLGNADVSDVIHDRGAEDGRVADPSAQVADADAIATARRVLQELRDKASPDSPDGLVLANFERLSSGVVTMREFSEETGRDRGTLTAALERIKRRVASALGRND
jgi:hypothetical protein